MGDVIAGVIIGGGLQIGLLMMLLVSAMMEPLQVEPFQREYGVAQERTGPTNGLRVVRETTEVEPETRAA